MPDQAALDASGIDVEAFLSYRKAWYDGSIRGMDTEIGRLLARIEELGLTGRVVVAVIGDHGEEFLEHGRSWHGQTVYGELTQVPFILWAPGRVPADRQVGDTVRAIDLMPTLLELSGLPVPESLQGQSLLPLLGADGASGQTWVERARGCRGACADRGRGRRPARVIRPGSRRVATDSQRDTR